MTKPYPADLYPACPCYACDAQTWVVYRGLVAARMTLCPTCGNKRCPGALNHEHKCDAEQAAP